MQIFKRKKSEIYWNPKEIDSTKAIYRMIIGQRSNGKSYSTLKKAIEAYFKDGTPSAYIRRYAEEIRPKNISELLSPHYKLIEKLSKGKYNACYYRSNQFILCYIDKETGEITQRDSQAIIYTLALNTWNTSKGQDRGQLGYIIFDEFMTRDLYLKDEFVTFANIISSLVRDRNINAIYMLGNTVNKYCPYFEEMGLYHVQEQEQGTIELYTYNNKDLTVAVEYCATAEATKDVTKYYAFDNPQLDMITNGNWEEAKYQRLCRTEMTTNKETLKFKFFVDFNNHLVVGEIHKKGINTILLFHKFGNSNYKIKDKDFVWTDKPTTTPYRQNSFRFGPDPAKTIIQNLFLQKKDYYDTNTTGEIINNFLKWSGAKK